MAISPKKYQKFDNQAVKTAQADMRSRPPSDAETKQRARASRIKVRQLVAGGSRLNPAKASDTYLKAVKSMGKTYQERQGARNQMRRNAGQANQRGATKRGYGTPGSPQQNRQKRPK